ncbi:MAG: hypothetical protein WCP28_05165 [Actinomycetes bacterium]
MHVPKPSKVALGVAATLIVAGLGMNAAQSLTGSDPVTTTHSSVASHVQTTNGG